MRWIESVGNGYTVPITAYYWVHVDNEAVTDDSEEEAWSFLESVLKQTDEKFEIYEAVDKYVGYRVCCYKFRVDFRIYAVATDADLAYNEAVTLIENFRLPSGVCYVCSEQKKLVEEEEPVYIMRGDNV